MKKDHTYPTHHSPELEATRTIAHVVSKSGRRLHFACWHYETLAGRYLDARFADRQPTDSCRCVVCNRDITTGNPDLALRWSSR